jgi:hypothetical protein
MMSAFDDALGLYALPPSPAYPIDQLIDPTGAALPPNATSTVGSGFDVPLRPPTAAAPNPAAPTPPSPPLSISPPAQASGGLNLQQILGLLQPKQQSDGFNMPTFMSSLGAGLSSAGQNWNKPAMAAFASGAGAALQGGQQWQNQQQDARLKALHAAIAAWKAGDIAAYHQALINLRAAGASSLAPPSGSPAPPDAAIPPPDDAASAKNPASPPRPAPDALAMARDAIARGAPRAAVIKRLREHGIDPSGL